MTTKLLKLVLLLTVTLCTATGCATDQKPIPKPVFGPGEGAISGKLVGTDQSPFDLSLAGEKGAATLRIELISPSAGVTAATHPVGEKGEFNLSHVRPGAYELSVYQVVPSQRTIAGSQPVTVDPGQITFITLTLQVTPVEPVPAR